MLAARLSTGEKLWTLFDTGAMGVAVMTGVVRKSGPKTATIEWESGIRNRLTWEWLIRNCDKGDPDKC